MPDETDDGSSKIDKLLAELENETLPEESQSSKNEKLKDKHAKDTLKDITTTEYHEYDGTEMDDDIDW